MNQDMRFRTGWKPKRRCSNDIHTPPKKIYECRATNSDLTFCVEAKILTDIVYVLSFEQLNWHLN